MRELRAEIVYDQKNLRLENRLLMNLRDHDKAELFFNGIDSVRANKALKKLKDSRFVAAIWLNCMSRPELHLAVLEGALATSAYEQKEAREDSSILRKGLGLVIKEGERENEEVKAKIESVETQIGAMDPKIGAIDANITAMDEKIEQIFNILSGWKNSLSGMPGV